MNKERKMYWLIFLVTIIVGIYWSLMFVLQQPQPLFIAFLVINIISLITTIICFVFDIKRLKGGQ